MLNLLKLNLDDILTLFFDKLLSIDKAQDPSFNDALPLDANYTIYFKTITIY